MGGHMTQSDKIRRCKNDKAKGLPFLMLCLVIALASVTNALAQRKVQVEPGFGTLNTAILSDTTETGARVDSNTVYVLQRGGLYLLDGSIEHRGYHLTIVAEDGDGDRPRLVPAVGTGGTSSRAFRPRGSLTLKGLYVTDEDEDGGLNTRIIRVSANDVTIRIDDCHLDKDGQSAFRVDGTGVSIFVTNSIISNIGVAESASNGRGIDDRGNPIDTLVLDNDTFYNMSSQIIRDDGGVINYARVNQCTIVNTGIGTAVEFGPVVKGIFTNNMVINAATYGNAASVGPDETSYVVSFKELTTQETDSLGEQSLTISNNNIFLDPAIVAAYPDTVSAVSNFNDVAMAALDEGTLLNEDVKFTNAPAAPVAMVTEYYAGTAGNTQFDISGEPYDFSYANSFDSYTAGTDGQPLGSVVWPGMATPVEGRVTPHRPQTFALHGNYPNPFNPTTNIVFDLPQAAQVAVDIFNVIGQKVLSVPAQHMSAGTNQHIMIDASKLASGVYVYRVTAKTPGGAFLNANTGKMTLIK